MFLDEARLSATLTHPNIAQVYDIGADDDAPFFAMEYVHGANLREMLRAQSRKTGHAGAALPLEHALAIVAGAAAGLHYAHERTGPGGEPLDIVHRDVSPSNVLVSLRRRRQALDFGIAKWATSARARRPGRSRASSRTCRPSSAAREPVDRRSDVFALGSILYELTTGTAPFAGASDLRHPEPDRDRPGDAARVAGQRGRLPTGAVGDRDARAGARAGRSIPQHAGAAERAGIVRARRRARAVDDGAGVVRSGAVRRGAGGVARGATRGQVAGRAPGGAAGGGAPARIRGTHRAPTRSPRRAFDCSSAAAGGASPPSPASSSCVRWAGDSPPGPGHIVLPGRGPRPTAAPRRCRLAAAPPVRRRTNRCRPRRRRRARARAGSARIGPLPVATAATKTKAKIRQAGRQARATPASEAKGQPATADSRLGAWDPDSPVPP